MVNPKSRRSTNRQSLNLWMNGQFVGTWSINKGKHHLQYANEWVTSPHGRMVSLSLPFQPGNQPISGEVVENFFDNLLPDNQDIRRRIQSNYHTRNVSAFELLNEIGRDCVGAIQLLPEGMEPTDWKQINARPLTEQKIEKHLNDATSTALPSEEQDEFRISIAGAQEKTALLWHNNQWNLPLGSTPTSHIMKLPLGLVGNMRADMSTSVENEWLCSMIMRAYKIPTASCEIMHFGGSKALVVQRFDRRLAGHENSLLRLPQEDMCQALGFPPSQRYENDGGPGMANILELLRGSSQAPLDRINFYKAQILFWMLAAVDGHAKNFSIFLEASGTYRMTPLYDVLSAWPIIGKSANHLNWHEAKLAMAFHSKNAHYKLEGIVPRHFVSAANKLGLGGEIDQMLQEIVELTPKVISEISKILPIGFPQQVADSIFDGLSTSAEKIERLSKK